MGEVNFRRFPSDIQQLADQIAKYDATRAANTQANEKISKMRLRLALWICRHENLSVNEDNLAAIVGDKLRDVLPFLAEMKKEMAEGR